jgi:hypothetical protein
MTAPARGTGGRRTSNDRCRDPDSGGASGRTGFVKAIGGLFCRMPKGNGFIYNT